MKFLGNKGFTIIELMGIVIVIMFLTIAGISIIQQSSTKINTTNPASTKKVLEQVYMLSDIEILGASPNACNSDDITSTEFISKNINQVSIRGVVCQSRHGELTVRFAP